ncbi:glypican-6 [Plutella xylostella]|uniref:glypican-6 n=1 Tax=Plutella xylostella TaxID=51655 RepID=UPI002032F94B|nr:glypican-6 [Plutella xylostella]
MDVNQCCCDAKLSPNKKSIFGLRTQILSLLFVACFAAGVSVAEADVSCAAVRSHFQSKGMLSAVDIQDQPNSDVGGLCLNRGCCAAGSAALLTQHARTQLETSLRTELIKLAEILSNRAGKFDEFFRKLLQQSKQDFDAMFKRTYGMIYEQHSFVFEQLFEQLERYYSRGDTDLDSIMETFFGILYQKMFTVLNSQYTFDEKYLKCVGEHMRETQPFEDVPKKLSVQLRRAFVATRTFHKALRAGADVVRNMLQVGVTPECITSWTRLRSCGACGGGAAPACSRYCHNTLRGCLPQHADLAPHWDAYVDAVEKVADRLIGPFNIVMVVEPIDIKISEAIMNFQEHNQEISQKIFHGCGKPVLGGGGSVSGPFFAPDRSKRSLRSMPDFDWNKNPSDVDDFEIETSFETVLKEDPSLNSLSSKEDLKETVKKMAEQSKSRDRVLQYLKGDMDAEDYEDHERRRRDADPEPAGDLDYRSYEFEGKRTKGKKTVAKQPAESRDVRDWGSPALIRLVRETRARVRNSRRYWANLPFLLCTEPSVAAPPAPTAACFNGTSEAPYTLPAAGEGWAGLASNPEVRATGAAPAPTQQDALKLLTARLKDAYNGADVHWTDADDLQESQSQFRSTLVDAGGSGSGSGDYDDLTDDDEDRSPGPDFRGSGQGPPEDDDEKPAPGAPATDAPFTPVVVGGGGDDRHVSLNAPTDTLDQPIEPRAGPTDNLDEPPLPGSGNSLALHKALITYALPVVCAWLGTMVTDLI